MARAQRKSTGKMTQPDDDVSNPGDQVLLELQVSTRLRDLLAAAASAHGCSLEAEIIRRLLASIPPETDAAQEKDRLDSDAAEKLAAFEANLAEILAKPK